MKIFSYQIKSDGPSTFHSGGSVWIKGRVYKTHNPRTIETVKGLSEFDYSEEEAPARVLPFKFEVAVTKDAVEVVPAKEPEVVPAVGTTAVELPADAVGVGPVPVEAPKPTTWEGAVEEIKSDLAKPAPEPVPMPPSARPKKNKKGRK